MACGRRSSSVLSLWILHGGIPLSRIKWLGIVEIVLVILVVVGMRRAARSERLGGQGLHGLSVWGFLVMLIGIDRVYEAMGVAG